MRRLRLQVVKLLIAIAALAAVGIAYWQLRIFGSVDMPAEMFAWNHDLYAAYQPVHHYAYRSERLVPLWNPHQLAGTPFRANTNGVLYPPNFLALVMPIERTFAYLGMFHVVLAGLGAFWCARAIASSTAAALLAAVMFMLSPELVAAIVHPSHLGGYAWTPLSFLAAGALLRSPSPRAGLLLGVVIALQLLTGSTQMALYTGYCIVLGGAGYLIAHRALLDGAYLRRVSIAAALALATAFGLGAIQILPTLEMLAAAGRQAVSVERIQELSPSFHLALRVFLGTTGAGLLAFAAPLDRQRRALLWPILLVLAFALLIGLGTPLFADVFYHFPLVNRFRAPHRIFVIAHLMIALAAAIGTDALVARGRRALGLAMLFIAVALAVLVWTGGSGGFAFERRNQSILAATYLGLGLLFVGSRRVSAHAAMALVLVVLFGRFLAPGNALMMPQHNPPEFFAPPAFARFLAERAGDDRVLLIRRSETFYPLMAKSGTLWGFNVVEDYEPLAPKIYLDTRQILQIHSPTLPEFWMRLTARERDERWRYFDLMSTRYVVVQKGTVWRPEPENRFRRVYQDTEVDIYENLRSLPRAYLVEKAEVLAGREDLLAHMLLPLNLDPATTVIVPAPLRWASTAEDPHRASSTSDLKVRAEEVTVRVSTPRPAVLVLTDLYWPGWRASVDGEPREIHRANLLFRAIAVEAGEHEVRFEYRPLSAALGAALTFTTTVLVALALLLSSRER